MNILLTNDDGIDAEGLAALAEGLSARHDVWIIAPDRERSGASHSVNLREPGRLTKRRDRAYAYTGTPADCVTVGFHGVLGFKPDVVVSGINRGPNLGTDIIYSGTCSAARQAALHFLPGIAVSCATFKAPFLYKAGAAFVAQNLEALMAHCSESVFVNINAPSSERSDHSGVWASPCRRHYHDALKSEPVSDSETIYHLVSGTVESSGGDLTDEAVIRSGQIALSLVLVHPQVHPARPAGAAFH